jgi:hypothetical protein
VEIRCVHGAERIAIRLRNIATRPNTAAGDGIWAEYEAHCYGLHATSKLTLFARSDLGRFIRDLRKFAVERRDEALLCSSWPPSLVGALGLASLFQNEAPQIEPRPPEVSLRIFEVGLARHVALEVRVIHRHDLQSIPVTDSLIATFEIDPSSLAKYATELEVELADL